MASPLIPISTERLLQLHFNAVVRWHQQPIDLPDCGFEGLIYAQHAWNFRLWHEEDQARSPHATDFVIAQVKRNIDHYNQQRNDAIERIDDELTHLLELQEVRCGPETPQNTETPGSAIDRLSILALRLYHYQEQCERADVDDAHRRRVTERLELCHLQRDALARSLGELLEAIFSGTRRHRTYRQMKMYNDPKLNPYLYKPEKPNRE